MKNDQRHPTVQDIILLPEHERLTLAYMGVDRIPVTHFAIMLRTNPQTVKKRYPDAIVSEKGYQDMIIRSKA